MATPNNPSLAQRHCDALWRCCVCPRDAATTMAWTFEDGSLPWLLVLCDGCAKGVRRMLERSGTPDLSP